MPINHQPESLSPEALAITNRTCTNVLAVFKALTPNEQANREVVLAAVGQEQGYMVLHYDATKDLCGDREFMLAAVKLNGSALLYAPEELRDDWEIVHEAIMKSSWGLHYSSDNLKCNPQIVYPAVAKFGGDAFRHAAPKLRADLEFIYSIRRLNKPYTAEYEKGFYSFFSTSALKRIISFKEWASKQSTRALKMFESFKEWGSKQFRKIFPNNTQVTSDIQEGPDSGQALRGVCADARQRRRQITPGFDSVVPQGEGVDSGQALWGVYTAADANPQGARDALLQQRPQITPGFDSVVPQAEGVDIDQALRDSSGPDSCGIRQRPSSSS